jgi:hypothetical protein
VPVLTSSRGRVTDSPVATCDRTAVACCLLHWPCCMRGGDGRSGEGRGVEARGRIRRGGEACFSLWYAVALAALRATVANDSLPQQPPINAARSCATHCGVLTRLQHLVATACTERVQTNKQTHKQINKRPPRYRPTSCGGTRVLTLSGGRSTRERSADSLRLAA